MNPAFRQGFCCKCELRLLWRYNHFGSLSSMKCPFCNGLLDRTTYYMIKHPTLNLLQPIKVSDSNYKCPHENCSFECGFDGVIGHQVEHKGINKSSPYYRGEYI